MITVNNVVRCPKVAASIGRWALSCFLALASFGAQAGDQVSVSDGGMASYSFPIGVPPGIAGMAPNLALFYSGGGVNGPVGLGWTVQGISMITRCAGNKIIDGYPVPVKFAAADKLCLDGQRLIQTDADGVVVSPQLNDSLGGSGTVREYRTEKDMYARIRAYGVAGGNAANGPAYFKVWTKSGQIYEYGVGTNSTANAQILAGGKSVVAAWPVSRIRDTVSNFMDFEYEQRDVAWGSGSVAGSPTVGREWNLLEVRYTGSSNQAPANKVVFEYTDRPDMAGGGAAQDRSESYHEGSKNVSVRLLSAIRTYINAQASPINVKTINLAYQKGPVSGRSRLVKITECAGASSKCLPPTSFNYAPGGNARYTQNSQFTDSALGNLTMQSTTGNYGVSVGKFFGDGRAGILRWLDTPSQNELYKGATDGSFTKVAVFNITAQNLFKSDGCYSSVVADFNGDGMSDILRIMQTYSTSSTSCGAMRHILYIGKGDGSFAETDVAGIDFTKKKGSRQSYYDCLSGSGANCNEYSMDPTAFSQTEGRGFHILDVNNDGLLDIVTTIMPSFNRTSTPYSDATLCATLVCTREFLGQPGGGFVEKTDTNLAHRSVYAEEPPRETLRRPYVSDANGDGLPDLLVTNGVWLSRGDGNFDITPLANSSVDRGCRDSLDFNGDGRSDCLYPAALYTADGSDTLKRASNFNLTSDDMRKTPVLGMPPTMDVQLADIDGDGRTDMLRWSDDPTQNAVWLSNGDGTFRRDATFNLTTTNDVLQKSDRSANFILGDFTGRGNTEILRLGYTNRLFVKSDSTPLDQLVSVTSGTGISTSLTWVPMSNSASGGLGARYASDFGTPYAAKYPMVDITMPSHVVVTSTTDSGVGTGKQISEYSYAGMKMSAAGFGFLGFREVRRQHTAPNGGNLTIVTSNLQNGYYTGVPAASETRLGPLNASGAQVLSRSSYSYCDKTSSSTTATSTLPCPSVKIVRRPYLYQSREEGWDLDGTALPVVVTTNAFNDSGDPLTITVKTTGKGAGVTQTFTKTTVNVYKPDDILLDKWILGRLQTATVTSSAPNSLASIATAAGTAPYASNNFGRWTKAMPMPLSPGALSAILSIILDE
ncbi:FG-GAP-like repeat-containing protein [Janthinobacterium sp. CG3]|uniref:FG-GAP-like repeat-containing protein n=1 Tax=Janthinobacterium sp. CG3 TaxID=1075768 RepID=UPI0012FA9BFB|nr:FG-GAP-like repeat-containing protein [Janthinobacterium sp. CG3]